MLAAYRKKIGKKNKVFQKRELNLKPKCSVYSDFSTRIHAKAGIMAAELGFTTKRNVYLDTDRNQKFIEVTFGEMI